MLGPDCLCVCARRGAGFVDPETKRRNRVRALLTEALLDWMDEDEDEDEDEERGPRAMIKAKVEEVEAALFDKFAGDTPEYRDKVSLLSPGRM